MIGSPVSFLRVGFVSIRIYCIIVTLNSGNYLGDD